MQKTFFKKKNRLKFCEKKQTSERRKKPFEKKKHHQKKKTFAKKKKGNPLKKCFEMAPLKKRNSF